MKYRILKEDKVYSDCPEISGVWYKVEPKNFILRFLSYIIPLQNEIFRDIEEAKDCKQKKEDGKWNYTKSREILNDALVSGDAK